MCRVQYALRKKNAWLILTQWDFNTYQPFNAKSDFHPFGYSIHSQLGLASLEWMEESYERISFSATIWCLFNSNWTIRSPPIGLWIHTISEKLDKSIILIHHYNNPKYGMELSHSIYVFRWSKPSNKQIYATWNCTLQHQTQLLEITIITVGLWKCVWDWICILISSLKQMVLPPPQPPPESVLKSLPYLLMPLAFFHTYSR